MFCIILLYIIKKLLTVFNRNVRCFDNFWARGFLILRSLSVKIVLRFSLSRFDIAKLSAASLSKDL